MTQNRIALAKELITLADVLLRTGTGRKDDVRKDIQFIVNALIEDGASKEDLDAFLRVVAA
jgi:hypothetical protein